MVSQGLSAKDKQEKVKNLPNQLKMECASLNCLSKGLNEILKVKDTKDNKSKSTPLTGISQVYDTKTEVTPKYASLFKYVNS